MDRFACRGLVSLVQARWLVLRLSSVGETLWLGDGRWLLRSLCGTLTVDIRSGLIMDSSVWPGRTRVDEFLRHVVSSSLACLVASDGSVSGCASRYAFVLVCVNVDFLGAISRQGTYVHL